ncbi:hypothetical protein [Thermocladium modestius]|uniref:hypothetical protein n=1 Tax=Thermocladium modestius TaxID=62609 RepID=UPI00166C217C|nr:hypothetical protein [Thermocladium modestius]
MVEFLGPGEFLLIRFDGVERVGRGGVVAARLERAPCPHRLIPDGDASVDELMDRVRRGGVLLVRRERRLAVEPGRLGLRVEDYASHYSRPVRVWMGWPGARGVGVGRAARPCILGGLECYSCQAGAITINKLLEALGAPITLR